MLPNLLPSTNLSPYNLLEDSHFGNDVTLTWAHEGSRPNEPTGLYAS